jgi:hypothetical protein
MNGLVQHTALCRRASSLADRWIVSAGTEARKARSIPQTAYSLPLALAPLLPDFLSSLHNSEVILP